MARTIQEIKKQITDTFIADPIVRERYRLHEGKTFEEQFSQVSLESILFYVFASACWLLEKLFDRHREDIEERIKQMHPHTLRWYAKKAKEYRHNIPLLSEQDAYDPKYDTSDWEHTKVVRYAVATESNTVVYIKVAGANEEGLPTLLEETQLNGLRAYFQRIKDAGVTVDIINQPADRLSLSLSIFVRPELLTEDTLSSEMKKQIENTITQVVSEIPFDGVFKLSEVVNALEALEIVEAADITQAETQGQGEYSPSPIVGYALPKAGYYTIAQLDINYKKYESTDRME